MALRVRFRPHVAPPGTLQFVARRRRLGARHAGVQFADRRRARSRRVGVKFVEGSVADAAQAERARLRHVQRVSSKDAGLSAFAAGLRGVVARLTRCACACMRGAIGRVQFARRRKRCAGRMARETISLGACEPRPVFAVGRVARVWRLDRVQMKCQVTVWSEHIRAGRGHGCILCFCFREEARHTIARDVVDVGRAAGATIRWRDDGRAVVVEQHGPAVRRCVGEQRALGAGAWGVVRWRDDGACHRPTARRERLLGHITRKISGMSEAR